MMEMKDVNARNLTGRALDWAVAEALGWNHPNLASPSTDWAHGGPLIEQFRISVSPPDSRVHRNGGPNGGWGESGVWMATTWQRGVTGRRAVAWDADSALVALCRCVVLFVLGETVKVPASLLIEETAHANP